MIKLGNGYWFIGDCLEVMKQCPNGVVDMILCDLPYGITQNKWDSIIPLAPLWQEFWRIAKPNAAIVLTCAQPFTTVLIYSQMSTFKYEWIWNKDRVSGHLNAKIQPLRTHESIAVFYRKQCCYNPQMTIGIKPSNKSSTRQRKKLSSNYGEFQDFQHGGSIERFPTSIIKFNTVNSAHSPIHPTQKPVALFEYLISTYTNEGDLVVDNCAGSGTTAIACENTNRRWVCVEQDQEYSQKAIARIEQHILSRAWR